MISTIQFAVFLTGYFLSMLFLTAASRFTNQKKGFFLIFLCISLIGLALSVVIGALLDRNHNFVLSTFELLISFSRLDVLIFLLGISCSLPFSLLANRERSKGIYFFSSMIAAFGAIGVLVFGGLLAGKEVISPYLPHPDSETNSSALLKLTNDDYSVDDLLDTQVIPIRIAVSPSGKIYVSGHTGIAGQQGVIVELMQLPDGSFKEKLVAKMLNHPYGLIAEDDRLFVSRSGQYTKWINGKSEQISTGAVTLLKDLDNDGVMDYYHDIVTGLPGAKGPDYLHQNNALAIDSEGALFVTTAYHSDASPGLDPLEGVVLKVEGENFENVETFATGLRNPFGMTFTSDGQLFATDNDPQSGFLGGNMGDKLLHIKEGAFFGHPFSSESSSAVSHHALRSKFALGGLTVAKGENFPESIRDKLFLVVYGEGRIMQIDLQLVDGEYEAKLIPFAVVPGAIDIVAAPVGDFYVAVYPDKIVRLRRNTN